ncbi:unnamed protein product [Orchesella dallaii]|uniref:Ionotropic glutamate receptor C-terminal domain-containing protein n=1 Tax=Orchesella dallaii TaxID=48710 RepID=A0ABP1QM43_9HEXA
MGSSATFGYPQLFSIERHQQPKILQNFGNMQCARDFSPEMKRFSRITNFPLVSELNSLENTCKNESSSRKCYIFSKALFGLSLKWEFTSRVTCLSKDKGKSIPFPYSVELLYKGTTLLSPNPSPFQQKYVRVTQPNLRQVIMKQASKMELRNFHSLGRTNVFIALGKMSHELFKWTNKTVISFDDPIPPEAKDQFIPTLHPHLFAGVLRSMDNMYSFNKSVYHVRSFDIKYNFAYCSSSTQNLGSYTLHDFSVLSAPFMSSIWIFLFITTLFISFALMLRMRMENDECSLLQEYLLILYVIVSDLIIISATHGFPHIRNSWLHVGWLLVCVLLSNLYTGKITSLLIKPGEEKTLGKLEELVERNFTLVFPKFFPTILQSIKGQLATEELNRNHHYSDMMTVKLLVGERPEERQLLSEEFYKSVAFKSKIALLGPWPFAISGRNTAQTLIEKIRNSSRNGVVPVKRKCHVGKRLVAISPAVVWTFFPPNVDELYKAFQMFVQNGIFFLWLDMFYKLNYGERVQDQQKVLSETHIVAVEKGFEPMGFGHRHTPIIFIMWVTLLLVCCAVFACEVAYSRVHFRGRGNEMSENDIIMTSRIIKVNYMFLP